MAFGLRDFKGQFHHAQTPPAIRINNSAICTQFTDFISDTFVHWVASGVLAVWGEVGVVSPPYLVLPITVEPSKPRLCHDERSLNLWIKDLPFKLDHLSICLSMFCLGISRPPLMTKVGISMFVSIRRQKHTLDLNGKTFSSCFVPCRLVGRRAPIFTIISVLSSRKLPARLELLYRNILTTVM